MVQLQLSGFTNKLPIPDGQPSLFAPNDARHTWHGLPVGEFPGGLEDLAAILPAFDRRPFVVPGRTSANLRYDVIVRKPQDFESDGVPVGVVSKRYRLVQHAEVLTVAKQALWQAGVAPEDASATLEMTENGERIALHVYLPERFRFDPGDGCAMALELTCFNSVDGSSKFMAVVGWFRFVCSNGMVVGVARSDIRRAHDRSLDLGEVGHALRAGLKAAQDDQKRFKAWLKLPVDEERLMRWVDGPVRETWGVKAAARALHICRTSRDAELVDRFEKAPPSQRQVRLLRVVPGMRTNQVSAFTASQALAWLAKERREIPEQQEWMERIPELVGKLAGSRASRPRASARR